MTSRLETNFNRLLHKCETMASEKKFHEWRLEKYVGTLQEYLSELRKLSANKPPQEMLVEYTRKVEFLRGLVEAEKQSTVSARAWEAEKLPAVWGDGVTAAVSQTLQLQTRARYHKDMRAELLGEPGSDESGGLRQRRPGEKDEGQHDIDAVMKHQNEMQEKIANEMIQLTRTMKAQATTAGDIIRQDNKRLGTSTQMADTNMSKLKVESDRLESHVARGCSCWVWLMLVVVMATFVWMVIFMRMFPKR